MTIDENDKSKMSHEKKYEILIEARNFHYDNFSKWMTYFYVAIGALFVGYCSVISSDKISSDKEQMLEYIFCILGFLVSLLWYWSAKGYYYWNVNFSTLINHYEKDLLKFEKAERIYFVFANKKTQNNYGSPISGANISTSKIAILFAFIITTFWGFVFFNKLFIDYSCVGCCSTILQLILSMTSIIILSHIIPFVFLKSKIDNFHDLKIDTDNLTEENASR